MTATVPTLTREQIEDAVIDRAVKAWFETRKDEPGTDEVFRARMRAAISALASRSGGVPDGYKLVPVEPTEKMMAAGVGAICSHEQLYPTDGIRRSRRIYKAMLAASGGKG